MSYDKETRKELMDLEQIEDNLSKRMDNQEVNKEDMDEWIGNNKNELLAGFIDNYNKEWKDYCKEMWNIENEE